MTKGVFTTKPDSGYDDAIEERYHFPGRYLAQARQIERDFVVYYEPRRGNGRLSYIATARVERIQSDPGQPGYYYAKISDFVDFDVPVPFRGEGGLYEHSLQSEGQTGLSGGFRNAIRTISEQEYEAILSAGFQSVPLVAEQRPHDAGVEEDDADFRRPIIEQVVRRPFREAAFARQVKAAYSGRCAFTRLEMRNGGGRTEVDAAHIKPVGDGHNGSDSIRNGLALSKTVHWMFDRGLLSVDSDYRILKAKSLVPEPILRLLHPSGQLLLPEKTPDRPHPAFLEYHRNHIFKDAKV
ncbi:MAG TPA: HNH endonuclease [Rhizomicrobium sp.]|jgi:putative restriction endonuclease|nr:HNH endonuclease [Rhizomicrobium sp.]